MTTATLGGSKSSGIAQAAAIRLTWPAAMASEGDCPARCRAALTITVGP